MDLMERYQEDKNFREYVDRYCKAYNRTVEETLNHALIQEVARYYADIVARVQPEKSTYVPLGECI